MIITESKAKSSSEGMGETSEFTMNLDGMMFDNLMNGIYADKIAAPIRELSTNARDGHARRGNLDRPFDIKLPTKLDQEFSVRDYGSSLTHEEVMHMYTVLGQSTKRETNDETGCLGLGSKSPFAYTSAFTVTCWLEGTERTYSAYITTSGIPNMSLVYETQSTEEQGVRVAFAVKDDDIQKFHKSAETVLLGFDPIPNVHPSTFNLASREVTLEGTSWKFCKDQMKATIIQGSVSYPIDTDNVALNSAIDKEFSDNNSNGYSWQRKNHFGTSILDSSVIMNVDIGSLDVVTSREALQYTERTIKSIISALKRIKSEVKTLVENKLDKADNYREACELLQSMKGDNSPIANMIYDKSIKEDELKYKGKVISQKIPLDDYDCMIMEGGTDNLKASYKRDMKNSKVYGQSAYKTINWSQLTVSTSYYGSNYTIVVQSEEQDYSVHMRMRAFWEKSTHKGGYLWVITKTDQEAEDIKDDLNLKDNEIFFLHKLKDVRMPKRVSTGVTGTPDVRLRIMKPLERNYYHKQIVDTEVVDVEDTFIYVRQEGQTFYLDKTSTTEYSEEEMMRLVKKLNTAFDTISVYTIPKSRKKLMDKSKAVSLNDYIKKKLTRKYIQKTMKSIPVSITTDENKSLRNYLHNTGVTLPRVLKEFCENIDKDQVTHEQVLIRNNIKQLIYDFTPELSSFFDLIIKEKFKVMKVVDVSTPILLTLANQYRWHCERAESVNALNEYINLKGYKT